VTREPHHPLSTEKILKKIIKRLVSILKNTKAHLLVFLGGIFNRFFKWKGKKDNSIMNQQTHAQILLIFSHNIEDTKIIDFRLFSNFSLAYSHSYYTQFKFILQEQANHLAFPFINNNSLTLIKYYLPTFSIALSFLGSSIYD
jgi:hypothetical protein